VQGSLIATVTTAPGSVEPVPPTGRTRCAAASRGRAFSSTPDLSPLSLTHPPPNRALLIGINYLEDPRPLRGCINDVHKMKKFLGARGFSTAPKKMKILTDDQSDPSFRPTKANILKALAWLVTGARPGDALFFHFSGHGGQQVRAAEDESQREPVVAPGFVLTNRLAPLDLTPVSGQEDNTGVEVDGKNETICPVDYRREGVITDDTLFKLIVAPLPSGCRLTAVMDSCHSGTGLDLPWLCQVPHPASPALPPVDHMAEIVRHVLGCQTVLASAR
jgi:hypothetical protein